MEPWFSGAVTDAVREAKTRRAVFIVYVRDESENSQSIDQLWSECWKKLTDTNRIVALRLDKGSEACGQFTAIYRVQNYPTIYFINSQNGQVLKMIDQLLNSTEQIEENLDNALKILDLNVTSSSVTSTTVNNTASAPTTTTNEAPTSESATESKTKSVDERVAEARARLRELQEKREEEIKEKEKQDEMARRRLGQQMLLDKQKKEEEIIRQRAEELRRDKLEQQQLQAKLKAQIEQDREEKRRKYEDQQNKDSTTTKTATKITTNPTVSEAEKPKVTYSRSRLQFRLTDGSFYTEDFSCDARMIEVYNYLQETLPANQYSRGGYVLRTTHTRVTLTQENPQTLNELDLVPSAVLLVIPRTSGTTSGPSPNNVGATQIFRPISLLFAWFMVQLNFLYQYLTRTLFGNRAAAPSSRPSQTNRPRNPRENIRTEPSETSTIRRFRNTQDDKDDDEEKRTWNGNSTQQM